MLKQDSPLLNLPATLDAKQAVFLDGIRHAAQIVNLSYNRLCTSLTELSLAEPEVTKEASYTHIFLDAWAFIDAADRFRCLWEMQPNAKSIPAPYSKKALRPKLQAIRDVRNVSAHIAQKVDQIVALNSSILGSINWVTLASEKPLKVKTHFIRPGISRGSVSESFAMPKDPVSFTNGSGCISLSAGKYKASLSTAYFTIASIVKFAEGAISRSTKLDPSQEPIPVDMFGSAELDTPE